MTSLLCMTMQPHTGLDMMFFVVGGQELAQQLRVSNILYNSGELGEMTGHHSRVSTALSAIPFKVEH